MKTRVAFPIFMGERIIFQDDSLNVRDGSKTPTVGLIYYTDSQLKVKVALTVREQLRRIGYPIVCVSLKPLTEDRKMGNDIVFDGERGYLTMFKQILTALEASTTDIIFFCEHDVLYPKEHFDFRPPDKDKFYYDLNWWKIRKDGLAVHWDAVQVSGLCCYRELAIEYYKKRVAEFDPDNFDRKFEPTVGTEYETYWADRPHIDIRHNGNLTYNKWKLDHFRDKSTAVNFQQITIDQITDWPDLADIL